MAALKPRETQIIPLELLASAALLFTFAERVQGRDIIFFIDNQSVCAALSKGCSKSEDLQVFTTCWHAMAMRLHCRVWFEWVDSKSNPADVLSREARSEYTHVVNTLRLPRWADTSLSVDMGTALSLVE